MIWFSREVVRFAFCNGISCDILWLSVFQPYINIQSTTDYRNRPGYRNWVSKQCPYWPPGEGVQGSSLILFLSSYTSHGRLFNWWVQFSRSVVSNSLWHHEPQHARPPCPSPTSRVYPNSWPLSRWCHPTISSSVVPFSSCPQSFSTLGSFQMSQFFPSSFQIIGVSVSFFLIYIYLIGG